MKIGVVRDSHGPLIKAMGEAGEDLIVHHTVL
jgi:hypothetical protein